MFPNDQMQNWMVRFLSHLRVLITLKLIKLFQYTSPKSHHILVIGLKLNHIIQFGDESIHYEIHPSIKQLLPVTSLRRTVFY